MIKNIVVAALLSVSMFVAPNIMAGPNPFSDCGIGAALFSDTKWAAVSSNVIWDIGTTAVTSATASPETCSGEQMEVAVFINNSYDSIVEETAKGSGEHVTTVLNYFGCTQNTQGNVITEIRSTMAEIVNSSEYDSMNHLQKASSYYGVVSQASQACSV